MNSENDLITKLMISKKIMDRHEQIGRGNATHNPSMPMLEDFQPVNASYNLPPDLLQEQPSQNIRQNQNNVSNVDKISNSKLPDEIKRLMIEHPIQQPSSGIGGSTLSNDLFDKAARLMSVDASGKQIADLPKRKEQISEGINHNNSNLKELLKEVVEEVLFENGLITESESSTNEMFKFRVGDRIFEGKLTKVRKVTK